MLPYFEWKTFSIGPLTLQVWGLFAALGVLAGYAFARREAARRGLDLWAFEKLAFEIVAAAFLMARVFHVVFYDPAYYLARPFETFAVWHGGFSSFGGFAGAALVFFLRRKNLPLFKTADALSIALPLGMGCGRIGCFLIHDHPGTLAYGAGKWLAVNSSEGPKYDLGLLLGIFDFLLFGWFLSLLRKPCEDGFFFALFMAAYGPVRFGLDFLRADDVRYFGLTPGQYGAIMLAAAGSFLLHYLQREEVSR